MFSFQCKKDLRSDEEIFAEKARELNQLQDRLGQMVRFYLYTKNHCYNMCHCSLNSFRFKNHILESLLKCHVVMSNYKLSLWSV